MLGQFITSVRHASQSRSYSTWFYAFKDTMSPKIPLSCATLECLTILEFKVPNLVAQLHIDAVTLPNTPNPGGLRKTAKCITFLDPLLSLLHHTPHPHGNSPPHSIRKTMKIVQFRSPISNSRPNTPFFPGGTLPKPALKSTRDTRPLTLTLPAKSVPSQPLKPLNPIWLRPLSLPQRWPGSSLPCSEPCLALLIP